MEMDTHHTYLGILLSSIYAMWKQIYHISFPCGQLRDLQP